MTDCEDFDPDNIFRRFKVMEFLRSFVGLSTTQILDVEVDLNRSAYLKTMCQGNLLKFPEAREISASHRAYDVEQIDNTLVQITFHPNSECITRAKRRKHIDDRFVFDLRLIQVDGAHCCYNECHAEIGRYYISGEYEYCKISHFPKIITFGDVIIGTKVTRRIRIRNESTVIAAKLYYVKIAGFDVVPHKFTILPNSSMRISISIKPNALLVADSITFHIRNPREEYDDDKNEKHIEDTNYLTYVITCESKVIYNKLPRQIIVESLHKLKDQLPKYTYIGDKELKEHEKLKSAAINFLNICKSSYAKKPIIEKFTTDKDLCFAGNMKPVKPDGNFCKPIRLRASTYDLFDIQFFPLSLQFGRVGLSTYGERVLTILNNTKYHITLRFFEDECVLYTEKMCPDMKIKLNPLAEIKMSVFCLGYVEGNYSGAFQYTIDNIYCREHPYSLQVGSPTLMLPEKNLKFGMVTAECFVTCVPIRLYNHFNVTVDFEWDEIPPETPFEIIPVTGSIPRDGCKICDVIYVSKPTRTKSHEVDVISKSKTTKVLTVELNIMTRKLSIKFLQPAVIFKDIPINLETIEKVKLENASREIVLFYIVEPLIPGLRIEPMSGIIRPKMVITFEIVVKISYVLEFAFDVYVKINNKENVILPISGNVVEPKIVIHPKNIYMSRVPCYMITYVPVTFQNLSQLITEVQVLDTGDENIFDVYIAYGNEKQRVFDFCVEGGQSRTVYIKVYDIFRREYEMYVPFKINGLLGPPNQQSSSTGLQYYIGEYEQYYENNPKVKLKSVNKDISYCRIAGVITVPWIAFSVDNFEFYYIPNGSNTITFTMTNVSKYYLQITILTSKLAPNFTLDLRTEENQSIINETNIKFELDRDKEAEFSLKFHPKGHGRFVSTAVLFLDKQMTIPYYNLTFIGTRETPKMTPSSYRVIFPPCFVGTEIVRIITLKLEAESDLSSFTYISKEEDNLSLKFLSSETIEEYEEICTVAEVELKVRCDAPYWRNILISFHHDCGSCCDVDVNFCYTYCPLTLHTDYLVTPDENPYPYFPLSTQTDLYDYLEKCSNFLERWMFQQGFRRDLFPAIPDTFHAISPGIAATGMKSKGINVSYLNFVRRIAGPLMKHIRKVTVQSVDESFKQVKEVHDTYREVITLMRSRGANLWILQAKFLLSYDQFVIYSENVTPKCNAEIMQTKELLADSNLFYRLSKQSWIDFILQSYKVFVMDSCFFDCVCVTTQPRDIIRILIEWYNEQIAIRHNKLRKNKPIKVVTNITTDLSDGIAFVSAILNYCPFLQDQFSVFCEISDEYKDGDIINNACLIIEAMNLLRLYFPLTSTDLLEPNFLQMLFLSVHLYVALPMYTPKQVVHFNPPLLRSSTRQVAISPTSQESLIFTYVILNNNRNSFSVEKAPAGENGKKMFISIKYVANFVNEETCILLLHGYNKTRIFDTYIIFTLHGQVGMLNPVKKCKVTGLLYRPNKVDVLVSSPFTTSATFRIYPTDIEPTIPVEFDESNKSKFYLRRLNLIEKEINLIGIPKEGGAEVIDHKLYMQIICLSTQIGNTWIWFRSEVGEFFIKVTTHPRWDLAIDTLQAKVKTWPMDPCSCGEACECYRTTILMIPHRNELMLKALRYALLEHASEVMMQVYDQLIESTTGKIVLSMLLREGGCNMSDVLHILRSESNFKITSRALLPRLERVTLAHHTDAVLALPITVPADDKSEKYSVTFTSDCGMDVRTYRIFFVEVTEGLGI